MLRRWFAPRPATVTGRKLFASLSAQARNPALYREGEAPDTPEGRFEVYVMHVVLVLHRLKGQGPQAGEISQAVFDTFLHNLDEGLRDLGVGDLSVGKKMRKLGEAIYGRVKGYDVALASLPDRATLQALVGRTLFGRDDAPQAAAFARYAAVASERLAAESLEQLYQGQFQWPEFAYAA